MNLTESVTKFIHDESAIAYGLFVIAVFLVGGTVVYIVVLSVIAAMTDNFNSMIAQGFVSQDTATVFANQLTLVKFLPIIMLIGLFLWGIVRALERKGMEG